MTTIFILKKKWQKPLTLFTLFTSIIITGCETTAEKVSSTTTNNTTPNLSSTTEAIPHGISTSAKIKAVKSKNQSQTKYPLIGPVQTVALLKKKEQYTEHDARKFLSKQDQQKRLTPELAKLFHEYPDMSAYMLSEYVRNTPPARAINLGERYSFDSQAMLELTFLTFPDNKLQLAKNLIFARNVKFDDITTIAIAQGVDPTLILPYSAANNDDYRITPLIESASITLYNQNKTNTATVKYKKTSDSIWQPAMDLQWEPVGETLTGSIVYLTAGTNYDVKVTVKTASGTTTTHTYKFSTWSDKPTIDSSKVYRLSDIYDGSGQLDLEALGIAGKPNAWAEIIGDPSHPIIDNSNAGWAVNIGSNSYIYFKNVTIKGGAKHAIRSYKAHDLWFDNVDISGWGREADYTLEGIGYDANDNRPINHDSAFALHQTGRVVVENSKVHDPRARSNTWKTAHPYGPTAFLAYSYNSNSEYTGQVVIRNNIFKGTETKRLNDVIESNINGKVYGGFVRDSAIYNNTLAYANDDIIELDGGQSNVLFYNNDISHAYCGVSVVPNMKGPSFIFNNYIHDLTDQNGNAWASIKAGGLATKPEGRTNIFYNYIKSNTNGLASSGYDGDYSYWVNVKNNVMIHNAYWKINGYSVYDKSPSGKSTFSNNYMFNLMAGNSVYRASINNGFYNHSLVNADMAREMWDSDATYVTFNMPKNNQIVNFTKTNDSGEVIIGKTEDDASE